ncbi:FIG049434: Periplasmic protein TonB, links inner and outer membranes [plant metagenome]|uniref:FIG049434: Periplasmic protein TonB, links inner and outer membranes n=1 Tax=plant metagenome TaxID=1297885 RepID=A0A484PT80_9ZZZZ
MTNTTSSEKKGFFDIHTDGIGYLQRARMVPVKGGRKADPYLACTIAAQVGPVHDPITRYFDVRVAGSEAKDFVRGYLDADKSKRPLVRFRSSDPWGDAFFRTSEGHEGEPGGILKGRLLKIEPFDKAELAQLERFELITRGIGYLNKPQEVEPKDRDPFLSCVIAALTGPVDIGQEKREYCYFDTIVATPEARNLVRRCVPSIDEKRRVLIAFRLDDMKADPFIYAKADRAGQPGVSLKSTLTHISLIKIDGHQVHPKLQAQADTPTSEDANAPEDEGTDGSAADVPPSSPAPSEAEVQTQKRELAQAAPF